VFEVFAKGEQTNCARRLNTWPRVQVMRMKDGMLVMWKEARQAMCDALDPNTKARYESTSGQAPMRIKLTPNARAIYMVCDLG